MEWMEYMCTFLTITRESISQTITHFDLEPEGPIRGGIQPDGYNCNTAE